MTDRVYWGLQAVAYIHYLYYKIVRVQATDWERKLICTVHASQGEFVITLGNQTWQAKIG